MTRDEWCEQFAKRMVERSSLEAGEAAAYAANMADEHARYRGADPDEWEDPVELCDIEMNYWGD